MLLASLFLSFCLLQSEGALAPGAKSASPPHWYEQVTGILAIPATLIGGAYSYLLIRRTRLESRKLELEIMEKTVAASSAANVNTLAKDREGTHKEAIAETLVNRQYSVLLLRYIVMELALRVYEGITAPVNWFTSLSYGGFFIFGANATGGLERWLAGVQSLTTTVINAGYWLLFLLLGWPLFKDVNRVLGIDLPAYSPSAVFRGILRRDSVER